MIIANICNIPASASSCMFRKVIFFSQNLLFTKMNCVLSFGGLSVGAGLFLLGRHHASKTEQLKTKALENIFDVDESRASGVWGIAKVTIADPKCMMLSVAKQQIVRSTKYVRGMTWTPESQWQPSVQMQDRLKLRFVPESTTLSDVSFSRGLGRVCPVGAVNFETLVDNKAEQVIRDGGDMIASLRSDSWAISFDKKSTYKCSETSLKNRTVYLFGRQLNDNLFSYTHVDTNPVTLAETAFTHTGADALQVLGVATGLGSIACGILSHL